jgi:multidrug resistance efflux pump
MDIVRSKSKKVITKKSLSMLSLLLLAIAIFTLLTMRGKGSHIVSKNTLMLGAVQHGSFNVSVRGIGVLAPKDIRWVSTAVSGRVERILIKAGAQVKAGDLLLELSNPELIQRWEESKWQLEEMEAQVHAQEVSLESQLLDREAAVIIERLNHERALLTLDAQQTLLDQSIVAVSQIDHAEVKIEVVQIKERWQLEIKRLKKGQENFVAQQKAAKARLNRMKRMVERAQQQVDSLNVRATMDSLVQEMPIELGQQISVGINLAKLASNGVFIAELRVPEKQVNDVAIGQSVMIDTRSSKVAGVVERIDPTVINGQVQIDVALMGDLPREARPDLSVEGVIEIANIAQTLFVKRPMFAKSFSEEDVYLLDDEGDLAQLKTVQFGQVSNKYIQIKSGLKAGESIIVSDTSDWQGFAKVSLN